jgi:hypothetical protein
MDHSTHTGHRQLWPGIFGSTWVRTRELLVKFANGVRSCVDLMHKTPSCVALICRDSLERFCRTRLVRPCAAMGGRQPTGRYRICRVEDVGDAVIRRPGTAVKPEEGRLASVVRIVNLAHVTSPFEPMGL